MRKSIDEIIESCARSLDLPIDDVKTIDKIIEHLVAGIKLFPEQKDDLRRIVSEKSYTANNPHVMLILFDVLGGKSKKALAYGIQGFEALGRKPEKLVELQNPDGLIEYVIATAETLEELVNLKDALLHEGHFYSLAFRDTYGGYGGEFSPPKKHLANSMLLVANEIAYRLRDVDIRDEVVSSLGKDEFAELSRKWRTRLEAHEAIVMAHQVKGKKVVNKGALEALAAYEALAGTYQARGFTVDLMEEYARIKYGVYKPSTGKAPEELKAEHGWVHMWGHGGPNWDQFFRAGWFGTKEPEWKKRKRQRAQQAPYGDSRQSQTYELTDRLSSRDPWELIRDELAILGVNRKMTYLEARSRFWDGIKQRRLTFIRMDIGTPEYQNAMRETAAFIEAWHRVEPLYKSN